jgi:formylglycine-generating enzyme required for sulfatase activity
MKKVRVLAVVVYMMTVVNFAPADTIRGIDINFVTIGNAGNSADSTGYGAVGYNYRIGKYEVTNSQWDAFTGAVGVPTGDNIEGGQNPYDENAVFSRAQQPTNCVSWYETLQFCNYLTSGDKSKGVYQFSGNNSNPGDFLGINRAAAQAAYGTIYFLPTTDEWYKAAYYKPDGSGYSLYANGTDTAPIVGDDTNYHWAIGEPWDVGVGNGTMEQNGTFDMMGNVWEWTETLISPGKRDLRGNSYSISFTLEEDQYNLSSSFFQEEGYAQYTDNLDIGFRIAEIPEPATILLLTLGGLVLRKKRR